VASQNHLFLGKVGVLRKSISKRRLLAASALVLVGEIAGTLSAVFAAEQHLMCMQLILCWAACDAMYRKNKFIFTLQLPSIYYIMARPRMLPACKNIFLCKRATAMKYEKYQVDLEVVLSEYHAMGFIVTEYE
jgi:hypothetical protein